MPIPFSNFANRMTRWMDEGRTRRREQALLAQQFESEPRMVVDTVSIPRGVVGCSEAVVIYPCGPENLKTPVTEHRLAMAQVLPFSWAHVQTHLDAGNIFGVHDYDVPKTRHSLSQHLAAKDGGGSILILPPDAKYGGWERFGRALVSRDDKGAVTLISTLSPREAKDLVMTAQANCNLRALLAAPAAPTALPPSAKAAPEFR